MGCYRVLDETEADKKVEKRDRVCERGEGGHMRAVCVYVCGERKRERKEKKVKDDSRARVPS